jgi:hypothetical protein
LLPDGCCRVRAGLGHGGGKAKDKTRIIHQEHNKDPSP